MSARVHKVRPSYITRISCCYGTRLGTGHLLQINNRYSVVVINPCWVISLVVSSVTPSS